MVLSIVHRNLPPFILALTLWAKRPGENGNVIKLRELRARYGVSGP